MRFKNFDFIEHGLPTVFVLLMAGFLGVIGWLIYDDVAADKIAIRKDQWRCTASHVTTTLVAQQIGQTTVMIPLTGNVCDQYSRTN